MKRSISRSMVSAASVLACVGLATSAKAIDVGPTSVYLWTSHDYSLGAGNAPGAVGYNGAATPTWTWQQGSMSFNPMIDPNGRVYFMGVFRSSAVTGAITTATNIFGVFSATRGINNSPDVTSYVTGPTTWATGQTDPNTGLKFLNNAGTTAGMSTSSTLRISGNTVGIGVQIGNATGTLTNAQESTSGTGAGALLQNNQELYTGSYGSQAVTARTGRVVALPNTNDWTALPSGTVNANDMTTFRTTPSGQGADMNASGTWVSPLTFATVGPNPATPATSATATVAATTGNASGLATIDAAGNTSLIARAGDLPFGVGGPQFKGGGSNGVGGFTTRINRNGQVFYDALYLAQGTTVAGSPGPGGILPAQDSSAWIYTPGVGTAASKNSQIYQESLNVPAHIDPISGLSTSAGSATWTGGISTASISNSFSNAGAIWLGTPAGGDTVAAGGGPAGQNNQFLLVSTAAGGMTPTFVQRQNDIAPGFTTASNVRVGVVNSSSIRINNAGTVAFGASLQSSSTAAVQPSSTFTYNQFGDGLITATGIQGNDQAVFVGTPGITGPAGLKAIARTGDIAPGFGGAYLNVSIASMSATCLSNTGDLVFQTGLTWYAPGAPIGVVGQTPAASVISDNRSVLWDWNATNGLVPLLYTGQAVEVETGVFKYINQWSVQGTADGDGGNMSLNANGQLVVTLRLTDTPTATTATSTSYIVLQVPAAGTGSLALLGLGAMARRRRR